MYIQITNRCNMRCPHCCFSCTSKGNDMSLDTFKKAMQYVDEDHGVTLGGGEPTLHPEVITFLGLAALEVYQPFIITNGTCSKELWETLVRANEREKINLHVTRPSFFHNDKLIPDYVRASADKLGLWWGDNGHVSIAYQGRAVKNLLKLVTALFDRDKVVSIESSACDEIRLDPNGILWFEGKCFGELNKKNYRAAEEEQQRYIDNESEWSISGRSYLQLITEAESRDNAVIKEVSRKLKRSGWV